MKQLILAALITLIFNPVFSHAVIAEETIEYTCPMHPHYISTDADGICPICGMDLVLAKSARYDEGNQASVTNAIHVSQGMLQTMGVRIAEVKKVAFTHKIRAFGNVQANTRREVVSASRLEGWIENLAVTAEGDTVHSGQLLYQIYSPELVAAQKDFLAALNIGNKSRIDASEQRLKSLGMQRTAIASVRKKLELLEKVPVYAEDGGIVHSLEARDGAYVKPGKIVLKLQSYVDVWIIASIVEQDINFVTAGIPVKLEFPSAPSAPDEGVVDYVYPTIDPITRTLKVRIVVANEEGLLRPGAFADVAFEVNTEEKLSIPSEAVLHDSSGSHVIVSLGEGNFSSRNIQTGNSADGRTEVTSGLQVGERVVVSGQFMLDSETNLREGFAKLAPSTFDRDTPLSALPLSEEDIALIDHFVDTTLYFHEALIDQYDIDPHFLGPTISAGDKLLTRFPDTQLQKIIIDMQHVLQEVREGDSDNSQGIQLAHLMHALKPWLLQGMPDHYHGRGIRLFQDNKSGHYFIQEGAQPANPYGAGDAQNIPLPERNHADKPPTDRMDPHATHR